MLSGLLDGEDHRHVGHHGSLACLVELDDLALLEPLQGQLNHADAAPSANALAAGADQADFSTNADEPAEWTSRRAVLTSGSPLARSIS